MAPCSTLIDLCFLSEMGATGGPGAEGLGWSDLNHPQCRGRTAGGREVYGQRQSWSGDTMLAGTRVVTVGEQEGIKFWTHSKGKSRHNSLMNQMWDGTKESSQG